MLAKEFEMPKIRVSLSIGFPGAKHVEEIEIDEEEWNLYETEDKEYIMEEYAKDWAWDYIEIGAELIE
jgi:hypothetical protein